MNALRPLALLASLSVLFAGACDTAEGGATSAETPKDCCAPQAEAAAEASPLRPQIPDVVLLDQHGQERHFYSDLVKGKLVLVNAIYTTCAGTCPMQTSIFASVQRHLKERMEKDVVLLSISLDPLTDRPEQLAAFAEKYGAGEGWTFLTGTRENVKTVLEAMDLYAAVPEDHTPICALGNEKTGVWMKLINLASPDEIVSRLDYVAKLDPQALVAR